MIKHPKLDLSPGEIKTLIEKAQETGKLFRLSISPDSPLRLNYGELARKMFPVEQMPKGADGYMEISWIEMNCPDPDHAAYGKPLRDCEEPECIVRRIMES